LAQAVTTSVLNPTIKKLQACDDDDDIVIVVLVLVVKEILNALYKYAQSRTSKHIFISCDLTPHVSIDIDQHQTPSTYPQTIDRILSFGRFLEY